MDVGMVGLGTMGSGIAKRLLAAGHRVAGWNRTSEKAAKLVDAGLTLAGSPREVAEKSEVVLSIVTDSAAVRSVALGPEGIVRGLSKESIYLDMSTIDPDESRSVAEEFRRGGLTMLDAPLSGSPVTLAAGKATFMVGGEEEAFDRVRPLLLDIGAKASHIGGNGLAAQMKLAINLVLMVEVIAYGEAIALAEKGGVTREVAVEAMLASVAASPVLGYRGTFILDGKMPERALADVNLQQKDMLLVLALGRKQGSPVPLAAAANEMMNACRGLGIDHRDFVTAHEVYRRLGGFAG